MGFYKLINALKTSQVNIIECGYLNDKKGKKSNFTLFDSVKTTDILLSKMDINAQKVVMINLGDFDIANLPHKSESLIDGIRLAFHKKDLELALDTSSKIINLGYKVYFQPMVTKNYNDIEFLSLVEKANKLDIHSFYIVDSFGSMTLAEFQRYMTLANNNLNQKISLGYHSHNNMQLAFSNAINMCNTNLNRNIIIDASIYGIGRGAGNLNTELITDYLNNTFNTNYETLSLLEIIDEFLNSLMKKKSWGFSPAQYLSASFDCHPNYATFLINKNTNHIVGVKKVLEMIDDKELLHLDISDEEVNILAEEFSVIMRKELVNKRYLIMDTVDFINKNYKNYNLHIVSGSDQEELRFLCKELEVEKYFISIYGSPIHKNDLVKNIFNKYKYNKNETILIGDSINDYEAAKINNIDF